MAGASLVTIKVKPLTKTALDFYQTERSVFEERQISVDEVIYDLLQRVAPGTVSRAEELFAQKEEQEKKDR